MRELMPCRVLSALTNTRLNLHAHRLNLRVCTLGANAVTSRWILRHADGRHLTWDEIDELVASNISTMSDAVNENPSTSYFEAFTALAIKHFAESNVDWAIMEAGLGGVMDATNVFKAHQVLPKHFIRFKVTHSRIF